MAHALSKELPDTGIVFGVWLPLLALIYAVSRSRGVVVVLAFCVGLSVNVVFLANATPANAATNNTSDIWMSGTNGTTFGCSGQKDMYQSAPINDSNGQAYYSSGDTPSAPTRSRRGKP